MTIVILDARGNVQLVASRRHVGPGERVLRTFTGPRHYELAEIVAENLG